MRVFSGVLLAGACRVWALKAPRSVLHARGRTSLHASSVTSSTSDVLLVVAAALINEGTVMMSTRVVDGVHKWEFPGGKVDVGETPEIALAREMKEELDVTLRPEDLMPLSFASRPLSRRHLVMPLYSCHKWSGGPTPLEGQRIRWFDAEALAGLNDADVVEADVPLLPVVAARLRLTDDASPNAPSTDLSTG